MNNVDHPDYYNNLPVECIDVAEHYSFNLGNAMKYIWRAGLKSEDKITYLEKARWYIRREIDRIKKYKCKPDEIISDGFGSAWSIVCPECEKPIMQVVRPGKVQCPDCG
jgi:hypothetical protein